MLSTPNNSRCGRPRPNSIMPYRPVLPSTSRRHMGSWLGTRRVPRLDDTSGVFWEAGRCSLQERRKRIELNESRCNDDGKKPGLFITVDQYNARATSNDEGRGTHLGDERTCRIYLITRLYKPAKSNRNPCIARIIVRAVPDNQHDWRFIWTSRCDEKQGLTIMSRMTNGKSNSDSERPGPRFKNQGYHIFPKGEGRTGTTVGEMNPGCRA